MPNVGPLELAIVLVIALVIFGPRRLPRLARALGREIRLFRGVVSIEGDEEDQERPPERRAELESPPS